MLENQNWNLKHVQVTGMTEMKELRLRVVTLTIVNVSSQYQKQLY